MKNLSKLGHWSSWCVSGVLFGCLVSMVGCSSDTPQDQQTVDSQPAQKTTGMTGWVRIVEQTRFSLQCQAFHVEGDVPESLCAFDEAQFKVDTQDSRFDHLKEHVAKALFDNNEIKISYEYDQVPENTKDFECKPEHVAYMTDIIVKETDESSSEDL